VEAGAIYDPVTREKREERGKRREEREKGYMQLS